MSEPPSGGGALALVEAWPSWASGTVSAGVVRVGPAGPEVVDAAGDGSLALPWASVSKLFVALAILVAVEEGTVDLDEAAGPPGSTVRHLLAHASGLAPDEPRPLAAPGRRRIYSNAGFEALADHLAVRAGMAFGDYLAAGVLEPLGVGPGTLAAGASPAWGMAGPLTDLLALGRELLAPTLVSAGTLDAARTVAFPGLAGVVPGFGRYEPCDWGLGFELRDAKQPHWTGATNSPATFGHFGRSGSLLWIDPASGLALASLAGLDFGPWAQRAWPALADAVVAEWSE
jgi:CubicO group peptidase (beta-lactamase class C family)